VLTGSPAHLFRRGERPLQTPCERLRIAPRDNHTGLPVDNDLAHRANVRRDDRQATEAGLDRGSRHAFGERGQDEDICGRQHARRIGDDTGEVDSLGEPVAGRRLDPRAIGTVAGDEEVQAGNRRDRFDGCLRVLVGDERAEEEGNAGIRRKGECPASFDTPRVVDDREVPRRDAAGDDADLRRCNAVV
jgi:hypothetical protein